MIPAPAQEPSKPKYVKNRCPRCDKLGRCLYDGYKYQFKVQQTGIYHYSDKPFKSLDLPCVFCGLVGRILDPDSEHEATSNEISIRRVEDPKRNKVLTFFNPKYPWVFTGVRSFPDNSVNPYSDKDMVEIDSSRDPRPWTELCTPDISKPCDIVIKENGLTDSREKTIRIYPAISGDSSSHAASAMARLWLEECEKQHKRCAQFTGYPMPMRVLDLRDFGEQHSQTAVVKVLESKGRVDKYACLSYTWGGPQPIRLLAANVSELIHTGARWRDLPKTIQDAIIATRRLGLNYLWIDSLCIIQDSEVDVAANIEVMGAIYRHSHVTLSVSKSQSVEEGCYAIADAAHLGTPFKPELPTNQRLLPNLRRRNRLQHPDECSFGMNQAMVKVFPLLGRAWTFQESLLAPRLLCFGPAELSWQCHECSTCECCGDYMGELYMSKDDKRNEVIPDTTHSISSDKHGRHLQMWESHLRDYVSRSLSLGSDRSKGLLGMVEQLQSGFLGDYVAGIWSNHFHIQLLWLLPNPPVSKPDTPWPSWSWLSRSFDEGIRLSFLGAGPSHYQRVSRLRVLSGEEARAIGQPGLLMKFEGMILPASWIPEFRGAARRKLGFVARSGKTVPTYQAFGDDWTNDPRESEAENGEVMERRSREKEDREALEADLERERQSVHCALICSAFEHGYFLILKCMDAQKQIYERVGTMQNKAWYEWEYSPSKHFGIALAMWVLRDYKFDVKTIYIA